MKQYVNKMEYIEGNEFSKAYALGYRKACEKFKKSIQKVKEDIGEDFDIDFKGGGISKILVEEILDKRTSDIMNKR